MEKLKILCFNLQKHLDIPIISNAIVKLKF